MRTITRRAIPLVVGLASLGAGAVAWSGNASANEGDQTGTTGAADDGQAFVDCMRSNGLPDFPDVTISSDGTVNLDPSAAGIDPFDETYRAALAACETGLPEGTELPDEPDLSAPAAPADIASPGADGSCTPPESPGEPSEPSS